MVLLIIVIFTLYQPDVGQAFKNDNHSQTAKYSEQGPEGIIADCPFVGILSNPSFTGQFWNLSFYGF